MKIRDIRGGLGMKEKQKSSGGELNYGHGSNQTTIRKIIVILFRHKADSIIEVIRVIYVGLPNIINWIDKCVYFVYQNSTATNYQAVNMRCRFEGQSNHNLILHAT